MQFTIKAGDDRTDEELLDDLDTTPIEGVEIRAMLQQIQERIAGMNGGKDGGTHGRLPGFATYTEIDGSIVAQGKELTEEELDTLLDLYDVIDPAPTSAGVACELCGEYADRYGRCGCDF